MPSTWLKPLAYAAVYLGWGTTYLAIRVGVASLPPAAYLGMRFVIAAVALAPLAVWTLRRQAAVSGDPQNADKLPAVGITRQNITHSAIQGFLLLVTGLLPTAYAELTLPSSVVAIAIGCAPAMFALLDWLVNGTRVHRLTMLAFALGISGVALLALGGDSSAEAHKPFDTGGFIWLAFGATSWTLGSVLARKLKPAPSPWVNATVQYTTAAVVLLLVSLATEGLGRATFARAEPGAWWSLLYIALGPSILSYTSYLWLLKNEPTSRVSTYAFVNPVVALVAGAIVLGEAVSPSVVGALALVLAGTALQFRTRR